MRIYFLTLFHFLCHIFSLNLIAGKTFALEAPKPAPIDYATQIKPFLVARCGACHGSLAQKGKLRLDASQFIRKGGRSGPGIIPNQAESSPLFQAVMGQDLQKMPPENEGAPLTADQLQMIKQWIVQGAKMPPEELVPGDPKDHWAFHKPLRPTPPEPKDPLWNTNPIDRFISKGHAIQNLKPLGLADKSILLRRVTLDLTGLPPTPEEIRVFESDSSPEAYSKVVERLLATPQYGERWGRHWMDVWRYADWHGRRYVPDVWNSAPQIWRWRDWIVQSLNSDKGYDTMVQQMLAADEMFPEDEEACYATGFMIRNWYALNPNDWMRSTVEHTGKAFLGLTFHCAHCHDHKYDPIKQTDYFRLRAFFEPIGIRQDRIPGQADPGPFQEYEYSALRKVNRLGSVRVYDKTPNAQTWMYAGGDERNRLKDRGPIAPGLPEFLTPKPIAIEPVSLPLSAWNSGMRPALWEALKKEAQETILASEKNIQKTNELANKRLPLLKTELTRAESALQKENDPKQNASRFRAISDNQSLVLDAREGRRIVQRPLDREFENLPGIREGTTICFTVKILKDDHFNMQLAKDSIKGLTAAYIAFEKGKILAYQPGTFKDIEIGKYPFGTEGTLFEVRLQLHPAKDAADISIQDLISGKRVLEKVPTALNGWNPKGDPTKTISFDARPGTIVALDSLRIQQPEKEAQKPTRDLVHISFEAPQYSESTEIIGQDRWTGSFLNNSLGSSLVCTRIDPRNKSATLLEWERAKAAIVAQEAAIAAAKAQQQAAKSAWDALLARMAAEKDKTTTSLAQKASRLYREAEQKSALASQLEAHQKIAFARAKPNSDKDRSKDLATSTNMLDEATRKLARVESDLKDPKKSDFYPPLGPTYPCESTGRRKALAQWITARENPLTARVAINHIWMRHFKAPLIATVTDFGNSGARPSHPELLDWLAVELMENKWSMKHIHRLMVSSRTYQLSSGMRGDQSVQEKLDPDNQFLWRMNVARMEAEVVRDSLLCVAGKLDLTMGGQELENSQSLTSFRRSLYFCCQPEGDGKSEFGSLFDAPESTDCYRRTVSIIPQQALALTNSSLIHELSTHLEKEITHTLSIKNQNTKEPPNPSTFVNIAYLRVLSRPPTPGELDSCLNYLKTQTDSQNAVRLRESLLRALFNHNDFVTIR